MIPRYRVTATLQAPLAIKRDRQSERSESAHSVGGTLVRGALAALYLQQRGEPDDAFRRVFLDAEACRFGPLDPGPHVFPLSAATCKRHGMAHAVVDLLCFRVAQHWLGGAIPLGDESPWRQCARCGADLKPHAGFWRERDGELYEDKRGGHSVAAHVGIDRETFTAAESIFYTLEAMHPAQETDEAAKGPDLEGWLEAGDDAKNTLCGLLESEEHILYVGHHRTRGYGRLRFDIHGSVPPPEPAQVRDAWETWSRALIDFLSQPPLRIAGLDPDRDFFFSLSFPNGAILLDELLRYSADPATMAEWLAPCPDPGDGLRTPQRPGRQLPEGGTLRCMAAITKQERVRGWNAAHGLPRQDEWGVVRGAVYAYWFQGSSHERDALHQRLARLAAEGMGLRRNEGFGAVELSTGFHSRFCRQESAT